MLGRIMGAALAAAVVAASPARADVVPVTVTEGTNLAITAPREGGKFAVDLQGKLFAIERSGGRAHPFSDDFLDPFWPDYAPDGSAIAVQSYADGMFHIWTVTPDGRRTRQLTRGEYDDMHPAWSPDGRRIAFTSARAGTNDIWTVDVRSGELQRITTAATAESQPTWAPDGRSIAYVRGSAIDRIDLDTRAVTTLVPQAPGTVAAPSLSPDGERIAFLRTAEGARRLKVSTAPGSETNVGTYDDVFPFPPEWLSDDRLLYGANGRIVVSNADTGASRTIPFSATFLLDRDRYRRKRTDFDSRAERPVRGIVGPALSPDGETVVFKALNDLWLLPIGGRSRRLTHDTYYEIDPAWSRDGRRIAYASDKAGTEDLYVLDVRSGRERRVTALPGAEVAPAWAPDGRRLAYQDHLSQTWTLDLETGATTRVLGPLSAPGKPSWSADGRTLALTVSSGQRNQIQLVDVAAGTSRIVEPGPFRSVSTRGDDGPVWSPDGRHLAFSMESTIHVLPVAPDGTPQGPARQITHDVSDAPTWSGDSRRLLYLNNGRLRMVDRDGSHDRAVPVRLRARRDRPHGRVVIHAGRLWDGRSPQVRRNVDITVVGNRIRSIEPHRRHRGRVVDASHLTVTPGLIDMHNHQHLRSKWFGDRQGRLFLSFGITSTRSTGDPVYRAVEDREALDAGDRVGPRFFPTGEMLEGSRLSWDFARPVMNERQLDLELSRARALDYELIKTYQRFPHRWQAEVTRRAHDELGIPTTSHYLYPGIAHGVDMQEHLSGPTRWGFGFSRNSSQGNFYEDVIQLFGKGGMALSTTLFSSSALLADEPGIVDDPRVATLMPSWERDTLREELLCALGTGPCGFLAGDIHAAEHQADVIKRILDAGGTVVAGTDAPLDNVTVSLHMNLRAMAKFGIAPYRVLRSATLEAARQLGAERDLGSVEPGKLADLAFVAGDPATDVADLARVQQVMKNGRLYEVGELMEPF